jgi:hypothetical protein
MHFLRMIIDAVLRAARILQTQPGYTMPLIRLHARLVRELGPDAGSYGQIYQQLKKRTDSFALIDTPKLLGGIESWPGLVQEAYDAALEGAGLGSCVRVTLVEIPTQAETCDLITALNVTLAELASHCEGDDALAAYVEQATQQLDEINRIMLAATDRPTIRLPDLPPAT